MSDSERYVTSDGGVFSYRMPVRWGDMDALNHVNNAVYFRYFEAARIALLGRAGLLATADIGWVLAHASCDFLKPLRYPADIEVSLKFLRAGRSSLELEVWISLAQNPDSVFARGRNVMVSIDSATGHSTAVPPAARDRLMACFVVPSGGAIAQPDGTDRFLSDSVGIYKE